MDRRIPRRFAVQHPRDRNFFLLFVLVCWLGVVMGFFPAVTQRMAGQANFPAPLVLQVHAISFTAWLVLLTVQILLIRTKRHRVHMALGTVAIALVPIMLVSGLISEQITQRFHFDKGSPNLAFFIVPLFYLAGLALFVTAAFLVRRKPAAHKRLMLLATTIIVGAGYGRWWGEALFDLAGDDFWGMIVNTFAGTNLIMLAALAYDWGTRRMIHPALAIGVPVILIGELATSAVYHSPAWLPVAQSLIGR